MKKLETIHLRIDGGLKKRFKEVNKKLSVNSSDLIRKWIEDYTTEKEKELNKGEC